MRHGSVAPEVSVPPIILGPQLVKFHVLRELVEPLLALRAADDFANARHQHIHRGHRSLVIIQAHVERFDLARIIENRSRRFEMFLGEETFVLGLQVESVFDGKFEFPSRFLQEFHRFSIGNAHKWPLDDELEALVQALVHKLAEQRQVLRALLDGIARHGFNEFLG